MSLPVLPIPNVPKFAADLRNYQWDWSNWDEIKAGDTITAITSITSTPPGLSFGTQTILTPLVETVISSGTSGVSYVVSLIIQTSSGASLEGQINMPVY